MEKHVVDYLENGWVVLDFPAVEVVLKVKRELEKKLSSLLDQEMTLERYHEAAQDDAFHSEIQIAMTAFYREQKFDLVSPLLSLLYPLFGLDISVQTNPYLRVARPNKVCDNIGYHRDTFYGGSPHEVSFFVPFVDLGERNTMSVISGSHTHAEECYPTTRIENPDKAVTKGSKKHSLGFMYAPKVMDPSIEEKMEPVPLKVGQALLFCLSTVHGCVNNYENTTRWSTDIRLMNTYAPVEMGTRQVSYRAIAQSPVTSCAHKYEEANGERSEVEVGLCLSED